MVVTIRALEAQGGGEGRGGREGGLIPGRLRCCMFLVVNSTELLFNSKNFKYFTFMEEQRDDY